MSDAFQKDQAKVRESVLHEDDPVARLAASLYNKPGLPSYYHRYRHGEKDPFWPTRRYDYSGSRFVRWHELTDHQKAQVRDALLERLDELGIVLAGEVTNGPVEVMPVPAPGSLEDGLTRAEAKAMLEASFGDEHDPDAFERAQAKLARLAEGAGDG